MPVEVLIEDRPWPMDDLTTEVPDMDDFEELKGKIRSVNALVKGLANRLSEFASEDSLETLRGETESFQEEIGRRLEEFAEELRSPGWKERFKTDLYAGMAALEQKRSQISGELDGRMKALSRLDSLDKRIEEAFVKNARSVKESFKKGLAESGRDFHEQIFLEKEQALLAVGQERRRLLEELDKQKREQQWTLVALNRAAARITWDTSKK